MLGKLHWFRCSHKKMSLPVTRRLEKKQAERRVNTYVVCLSCGQQIPYSFQEMKTIQERRKRPANGERHGRSAVLA